MANGRKFDLDQHVNEHYIDELESDSESSSESEENNLITIIPPLPRQGLIDLLNLPAFPELDFQPYLINNINIVNLFPNLFPVFSIWNSGKKIDFLAQLPTNLWLNIFDRLDDKTTLQLSSTCITMRSLFNYKWPKEKNYNSIEPQEENSLETLPPELILFIYELLDVKSVLQLSMTCRLLSNFTNLFNKEMRLNHFIETFNLLKPEPSFDISELFHNINLRNRDLFNNDLNPVFEIFRRHQPARGNQGYGHFFNRALPARYEHIDWVPEEHERGIQLIENNNEEDNQWRFNVD